MFLSLLETLLAALFIVTFASQIVIPLWRGTKLFPLFRKESQLASKLAEVKQDLVEDNLKAKINKLNGGK